MNVNEIRHITVVGAGLMGHGIAQEFALAGYQVQLHSRSEASLHQATLNIQQNLERLIGFGMTTREQAELVPARIHTSTVLKAAVEDADIVFESVYEDLDLKRDIFGQLDKLCPAHTILASNTSSLMPSAFATATQRADKVLVAHYANPPYLIPLVEIVPSGQTSDATVATVADLLKKIGKRTIVVQQEVPGFVLNRLQGALLREALWLVENDIATPQDVDVAIKNSIGRRWAVAGIFEIFEIAGWDLLLAIAEGLFPHLASSSEVSPLLKSKVERGELGVKTGKGFYEWTPEAAEELKQRIAKALVKLEKEA